VNLLRLPCFFGIYSDGRLFGLLWLLAVSLSSSTLAADGIVLDMADQTKTRKLFISPVSAFLAGKTAPPLSAAACDFSIIAAECEPQVAVMEPDIDMQHDEYGVSLKKTISTLSQSRSSENRKAG